jgi:hypothetical protein
MSALGQKRTCAAHQPMSALPPIATAKADIVHSNSCPLWAKSGHDSRADPRGPLGHCSALRFDLSSKGLRYYLPVPHNKRVGNEFVGIVRCFGGPENIAMIALNRSVLQRE